MPFIIMVPQMKERFIPIHLAQTKRSKTKVSKYLTVRED